MEKRLLIILMLTSLSAWAQTNVGGTVNTNTTWTMANSPYVVTSGVVVTNGVTLTIESGVTVKFNDNIGMVVNGSIAADGVVFTASNASPTYGTIGELRIGSTTGNLNGSATLANSQFLYFTSIKVENGSASFTTCTFSNFSQHGIQSYGDSDLTITDGTMNNMGKSGDYNSLRFSGTSTNTVDGLALTGSDNSNEVAVSESATLDVTGFSIQTSTGNAVWLGTSGAITVTDCSFNNAIYPIYINQSGVPLTFSGTNSFASNKYDAVYAAFNNITSNTALMDPGVPYHFYSSLTVNTGKTLTIESGTIIKMQPGTGFVVEGKLTADAAEGERIYFTSVYDDNLGGDSNDDANNSAPGNGRWYGVTFQNTSDDASVLRRVEIRWIISGYGAINLNNASPTIDFCDLKNTFYGAAFNADSNPTFTNNTIASSSSTPVAMSFEADPIFTDNQFSTSDNEYDAIGLLGGTLTADANIVKRDFTDVPNVTYVMLNSVTIPTGMTLTVDPGVVIKSLGGHSFVVNGKLLVNGTAEEKVVFTSVNDDNHGNPQDTRNDGTNQTPAVGHFGGFYFSETSDNASAIDHAIIRFANNTTSYTYFYHGQYGWVSYYHSAAIAVNNTSPSITNSLIANANSGFDIRGLSSVVIDDNEITSVVEPFRMAIQATPVFGNNTFTSVGMKSISILPEWINYSATLSKRDVPGLFNNITYTSPSLTINEGAQITIAEGVNIKMFDNSTITVLGGLKIEGTAEQPVLFTVLADDNAGASANPLDNDTQSNGNATTPDNRRWGTIYFAASSDDAFSSIQHAQFRYGGNTNAPISWQSASADISHVTIKFSNNYGLWFAGDSNPLVDDVFIQTSRYDPLAMSFFANPTFTNIVFDANGSNGIRLIDSQITSSATLNKRDVAGITNIAYILDGVTVKSGATLTINPGVVIKLTSSTYSIFVQDGALDAQGTSTEKIIFTSIKDDSRGGDTNNNGNADPPASGNWGGVHTGASALQSTFRYCEFRYCSNADYWGAYYGPYKYGTIVSENNDLIVDNCVIQFSNTLAFGIFGTSTATITNNSLQNVSHEPVHMSMFSAPTFDGNTLENVGVTAIRIYAETYTQSATFVPRSFAGYENITYTIDRGLGISSGTTITIPAGMHIKGWSGGRKFDINGQLIVAGTAESPVVFTSIDDDTYGRPQDTQGNGAPSYYYPVATWFGFNNISDDASIIEHAVIRYANNGIELNSASPSVKNNLFEHSTYGINAIGISEPTIEYNNFKNLTYTPFTTSLVAFPASTEGNTMEGTTWKAIWINSETLTQDTAIFKRAFGGLDNIPYVSGNYTVGPGVKLKVKPGVIWKFYAGYLNVSGALEAVGGVDAPNTIVFTDIQDDFYGGDTEVGYSIYYYNHFGGITFRNESSDSQSKLDHVIVRYSFQAPGVTLESASPTITNSSFRLNGTYGLRLTGASNPTLEANDFYGNATYGIYNEGNFNVDATGSWWGDNSGPYHSTTNVNGKGNRVSDNVIYDPWGTDKSLNPITGDVSLNGTISSFDAALTLQSVVSLITLDARQEVAGDVSGDDNVNAMDASYILQYSAGLIQTFPAESTNKRTDENWASTHSALAVTLTDAFIEEVGQEVLVPITLNSVGDLYAVQAVVKLDSNLELVGVEKGELADVDYITNFNEATRELKIAFANTNAIEHEGVLAFLRLKVSSANIDTPVLSIGLSKVMGNETDVTSLARPGAIFVGEKLLAESAKGVRVYPNPAIDHIIVQLNPNYEGYANVELADASGKSVTSHSFFKTKGDEGLRVNTPTSDRCIYLVKVRTSEGVFVSKLVVGH